MRLARFKSKEFIQGVLSLLFFLLVIFGGAYFLQSNDLQTKVREAQFWAPFIFILLKSSTIIIAPLGGTPFYLIVEPIFGFKVGYILLVLGDILGYVVVFWLGRWFGRSLIRKLFTEDQARWIDGIIDKMGTWKGLTTVRIVFFIFSDLISYAAGLTRISFKAYTVATGVYVLIYALIMISFGSVLVSNSMTYILGVLLLTAGSILVASIVRRIKRGI